MYTSEKFKQAIQNQQENNLDDAQKIYNEILKINPNHIDVHFNLGIIFTKLKEYQKAKNCFEKVIKINPKYFNALNNLGVIFKILKEYQKAKNCFEKAIARGYEYADPLFNLGNIHKELDEHQESIKCYKKVIEINSNHKDAHNNLGLVFKELGDFQKAKSCYENAIKIDPNYFNGFNNLAIIFHKFGESQKAIHFHEKAIELNPNLTIAHNNLGLIFNELGEYLKALKCFERALQIDPNDSELVNNLTNSFRFIKIDNIMKSHLDLKKLFLFLFRNKNIYHKHINNNIIVFLFETKNYNQRETFLNTKTPLLENEIIQKFLNEELLQLVLQKSLLSDIFFEKLIIRIRSELLLTLNSNRDHLDFIISLAEQCWLNEFIYAQSDKEINFVKQLKDKIENDKEINELEIAILGCYTPLNSSKIISNKLLNYKSENVLFNDLIDVQINEPLKEIELKKLIKSLDQIEDSVSKKVREQYEENPYPRWRYTYKITQQSFLKWIDAEIKPNKIIYNKYFDEPNVLIAGCGTGNHTISAMRYKNASITSIDLSLASLAYAKRKTDELGFNNIEYLHADILQLKKLNKKFDIIESSGVLHHMKDPVAGLKILVDILEPHGFLKIGLYSEIARQHIVSIRKFIKENNFKNTVDDIKTCRQLLINDQEEPLLKRITIGKEFYSTSSIRDLLFHVQEHRFTLPEISKMLKDLNLEFLGFIHPSNSTTKKYSKYFPDDKKNTSLDNWHEFEKRNPDTFFAMYNFWIKKIQ